MTFDDLTKTCGDPLTCRDIGGIYVALFFNKKDKELYVFYSDVKTETEFTLNPPRFLALDTYHHPIYYAKGAMNGTENPRRIAVSA